MDGKEVVCLVSEVVEGGEVEDVRCTGDVLVKMEFHDGEKGKS